MTETGRPVASIAQPGRNCWRIEHADRFAFLVDAAVYFETLADALESARRSVIIVGWDVHSRMRLRRDAPDERSRLNSLLDGIARRNRDLEVRILDWDFAMVFAMEREMLPVYRFDWTTHRRVTLELDGNHPAGASHHQKIVVIDDALAFTGGLDLTMRRLDTPDHRPKDPERVDPRGTTYGPFHDVQCMVDGAAAAALGDLARERWQRATGERLEPPGARDPYWPDAVEPDLVDVDVAIARTDPEYDGRQETREIEAMYRDALAAARRFVYIENQYLSSDAMRRALGDALRRADGPEVVIVLPEKSGGWLEVNTVGRLRAKLIQSLREADTDRRLRIYYPTRSGLDDSIIKVHSKVCVIDDDFATVGSANLSNRSMGLDTECNVFVESRGETGIREGIAAFRRRLLAEHLGADPARVAAAEERAGSLLGAIDELRGGDRTLEPLREDPSEWSESWIAEPELLDPERPIDSTELARRFLEQPTAPSRRSNLVGPLIAVVALLLLGAAWRWTPLGDQVSAERIQEWIESYRTSPLALPTTVALYVVAGFLFLPVTLLIVQTAIVFPPGDALVHTLAGSMASAAATYAVGRLFGRRLVGGLVGKTVARIGRVIDRRGVLRFAMVRMLPFAPYSLVNLVAGACEVRFRTYLVGTLLGMLPGILALTVLGEQFARVLRDPTWWEVLLLSVVALVAWGGLELLSRWARSRSAQRAETEPDGA